MPRDLLALSSGCWDYKQLPHPPGFCVGCGEIISALEFGEQVLNVSSHLSSTPLKKFHFNYESLKHFCLLLLFTCGGWRQLCGAGSLLLLLCGIWGSNPSHEVEQVLGSWVILPRLAFCFALLNGTHYTGKLFSSELLPPSDLHMCECAPHPHHTHNSHYFQVCILRLFQVRLCSETWKAGKKASECRGDNMAFCKNF